MDSRHLLRLFAGAAVFVALTARVWADTAAQEPTFNRDIRPILSNNCFACHGPDSAAREADLSLHTRAGATSEQRNGGPAIVAGDADASELLRRVAHADPAERMPPSDTGKRLSIDEIDALRRWIDAGAEYEPHWAYIVPTRPELPAAGDDDWVRNPVDAFVLQRVRDAGLEPGDVADKRTLIRRVSLDLIGLPPTLEEVSAFVADDSHDAYERLVERLMASPHYGERQAIPWLDAVRYADTWGYHADQYRSVWPYRDYIVNALNANLPFDRFTIEQLAGDYIDKPSTDQIAATTFNFMNKQSAEGGAQDKEYLAKYMADRVGTVGTAWLGQTMGCAECHDHKFDPISASDFYSMQAFFADIEERGKWAHPRGGFAAEQEFPIVYIGSEEQMAELERRRQALVAAIGDLAYRKVRDLSAVGFYGNQPLDDERFFAGFEQWLDDLAARAAADEPLFRQVTVGEAWSTSHPPAVVTEAGGVSFTGDWGEGPGSVTVTGGGDLGQQITALQIEFDSPVPAAIEAIAPFVLDIVHARVRYPDGRSAATKVEYHFVNRGPSPPNLHYYGIIREEAPRYYGEVRIISFHKDLEDRKMLLYLQQPLDWQPGSELEVEFVTALADPVPGAAIGTMLPFTLSVTDATEPGSDFERIVELAARGEDSWTEEDEGYVRSYYRAHGPNNMSAWRRFQAAELAYLSHAETVPSTWAVTRVEEPRPIRVLPGGDWQDESGPVVEPAVPEFLGTLVGAGARATRLDLARWLVSRDNPLTARTQVNRLWAQFFGRPLSLVQDDLGVQGHWPSHPDLLDWLAAEFHDSGWDPKHMVRLLVTSATYRQSSAVDAAVRSRDPENRFLARQAALRLPAEIIRDNALAISGLLNPDIGGPSVRPYQPKGYYSILNFPRRVYQADRGSGLYRRGLYMHWQRTRLHPFLRVFGAPTREEPVAERPSSTTPLQALALLNDPTAVEFARAFGALIVATPGLAGDDERLGWAFERATAREPSATELGILRDALQESRNHFESNPDQAGVFLGFGELEVSTRADPPELAAWSSVARIILNLHETITRS